MLTSHSETLAQLCLVSVILLTLWKQPYQPRFNPEQHRPINLSTPNPKSIGDRDETLNFQKIYSASLTPPKQYNLPLLISSIKLLYFLQIPRHQRESCGKTPLLHRTHDHYSFALCAQPASETGYSVSNISTR
jgi:hypothetical protein